MALDIPQKRADRLLFDAMAAIYKFERRKVQLFGINYEAFFLLYYLRRRSSARMREIAAMDIHISTASRAVSRLEKRRLVSRKPDPGDRRSILVSLEPEGERLVAASEKHSYETIKENLAGLEDETLAAIVTTAAHFEQILKVQPG